jgi:hypothetical protein
LTVKPYTPYLVDSEMEVELAASTRKELDELGCSMPNCDHDHSVLYFNGRCHTGGAVEVAYHKEDGCIHVSCFTCKAYIGSIKVADE